MTTDARPGQSSAINLLSSTLDPATGLATAASLLSKQGGTTAAPTTHTALRTFQAADLTCAPFVWAVETHPFSGQMDSKFLSGYNADLNHADAACHDNTEQDYYTVGHHYFEKYWQNDSRPYSNDQGTPTNFRLRTLIRSFYTGLNRETMVGWTRVVTGRGPSVISIEDSTGTQFAAFTAQGAVVAGGAAAPGTVANGDTFILALNGGAPATATFVVPGDTTLSACARRINDAVGAHVASVELDGAGAEVSLVFVASGTSARINITGGTAVAKLGHAVANTAGSAASSQVMYAPATPSDFVALDTLAAPTLHNTAIDRLASAQLVSRARVTACEAYTDPRMIADVRVWTRADRGVSVAGTWSDQSGGGHDLVQATAGKRPVLQSAAGPNGRAWFKAVSASAQNFMATPFALAQPFTVFLVAKFFPKAGNNGTLFDGNTGNHGRIFRTSTTNISAYAGATLGNNTLTNNESGWALYTVQFNGATSIAYTNGNNGAGGQNAGASALDGITLFDFGGGAGDAADAGIAELIVAAGVLSAQDLAQMWRYQCAYNGIALGAVI